MRKFMAALIPVLAILVIVGCEPQADDASIATAPGVENSQQQPPDEVMIEPTVSPEQMAAALGVLEEINGTVQQNEAGDVTELNLAGRRWADEAQVTQILDAMPEVNSLTLEGRNMTDALGKLLASLPNLEVLALRDTMVGDRTLQQLAENQKLKIIDIRVGANLTDVGINALSQIEMLRAVRLIGCDITDVQISLLIDELPELTELDIRSSRGFTLTAIEKIQTKESLRTLKLAGAEISNEMIGPLANMANLTSLSLQDSDVDDDGLILLTDLPLKSLVLSGGLFVGDPGLAVLENYEELSQLNLSDTGATTAPLALLPNPEKLTSLDMSLTGIGDQDVDQLARFESLATLAIRSTMITPEGVARLEEALPNCRVLAE
jgi:hypothetical protein